MSMTTNRALSGLIAIAFGVVAFAATLGLFVWVYYVLDSFDHRPPGHGPDLSFLVGIAIYVGAAIIPVWAGIRVGRIAYRQLSGRNENDASAKHDA